MSPAGWGRGAGVPPQHRRSHRAPAPPSPFPRHRARSASPAARRALVAALALVALVPRYAAAQRRAVADSVARPAPAALARWLGCWALHRGDWTTVVDSSYDLPAIVQLDSIVVRAASTRRRRWYAVQSAMPPFLARRPLLAVVAWRPIGADSVAVAWSDGFARVTLTLGASGDSLSGVARWRRITPRLDTAGRVVAAPRPRAVAAAVRTPCPG